MTAIFLFSAQNGDTSNNTSNFVITLLEQLFHLDIEKLSPSLLEMLSFVVRKCAHMSEYALLCILWVLYMKEAHFTKAYMLAYGLTVIYAVSDEIHQDLFIRGISTFLLLMLMPHLKNLQLFVQHQVRLSIWRVYRRLIYYF